jgi:ubiquitin carboxyl-terminal hydrolase 5/13
MGFGEQQARDALRSHDGDLEAASMALLSGDDAGGGSGQAPIDPTEEKVLTIVGLGFTRDQALRALRDHNGDLDQAVNQLLAG